MPPERREQIAKIGYLSLFYGLLALLAVSFGISIMSGSRPGAAWFLVIGTVLVLLGSHLIYFSEELSDMRPWIQAWQTPKTLKLIGVLVWFVGGMLVLDTLLRR